MDPLEAVAIGLAAFFAGGINAVAGGGTLIGFPVLIALGYGAKVSNVTNTIGIWPGTVGGSLAYRSEISRQRSTILAMLPSSIVGAVAGSALLLATPESTFERVVPFLILSACVVLALQDRLTAVVFRSGQPLAHGQNRLLLQVAAFFVAVYGGYFGAAMGIIMLAIFGLFLPEDMQHANALKGLLALVINGMAVIYFSIFADVAWEAAGIMALCALAGGYVGGRVARKLPRTQMRMVAVTYGTVAAIALFFTI